MVHALVSHAYYLAHGYCLLWKPWLVAMHAGSDLVIFASYFAIPVAIWLFLRRRHEMELRPCLFYSSPSPRDMQKTRMPPSA